MKKGKVLSLLVMLSMLMQIISFAPIASAQQAETTLKTDGIDWFELSKTKGGYMDASNPDDNVGMTVKDNNRLYDLADANDAADFDSLNAQSTAAQLVAAGKKYVAAVDNDAAMKHSQMTGADAVTKNVWMTTSNTRKLGTGSSTGGNIYFSYTGDKITKQDKKLYIIIEYLEYGTGSKDLTYITNPGPSAEGGSAAKTPSIVFKNTNKWVTAVIPVDNAGFSNTETSILQGGCEFRINANSKLTYVSRIGIVKQSDVSPVEQPVYYAPTTQGAAPTLWLVGSSSNENYGLASSPREGWSMEIENFFKTKTHTPANINGSQSIGQDKYGVIDTITDGVTIITKAKGGKSTRTFLSGEDPTSGATNDKRWDDIKENAKPGDYLIIDLGSNDASSAREEVWTNPFSPSDSDGRSYRANLVEFIKTARELNINVILSTPKCNRSFDKNGKISDSMAGVRATMHDIGRLYGVPVLSVGEKHIELVEALGTEYSKLIFGYFDETAYPDLPSSVERDDDIHMNWRGAIEVCKIIVNQLEENKSKYQSVDNLYKWVDTTVDTTPMSIPYAQTESIEYDVSNVAYIVNGAPSDYAYKGEVAVTLDVKNTSDSENTAVLYTAVYDKTNKLVEASATTPVTLASGESKTLTSDAVTFPGYDGYTLRKFVWNTSLKPYDENDSEVILTADGYLRRAVLSWSVSENIAQGATYDIYRDDMYIASTTYGSYIDEDAERGERKYQINVKNADGKVIAQSAYAIANVTSLYDLKNTDGVYYTSARINAKGEVDNINNGIKVVDSTLLVPANEAAQHFNIDPADHYDSSKDYYYNGQPFVIKGTSDAPMRVVRAVDINGDIKYAYQSANTYRYSQKATCNYNCINFVETDTDNITDEHQNYTIFVEYMGKRSAPELQYVSSEINAETGKNINKTITATAISQKGEWCIARYNITDACFIEDTPFTGDAMFRVKTGGSNLYISSVLVVNNDICPKSGDQIYAELNNMNFYDVKLRSASKTYPNGISVEFDENGAVSNGIDVYYTAGSTSTADHSAEIAQADDGTWYFGTRYVDNNGSPKGTYLYFKTDKDYVFGASDKNLVMEVTYKADYDTVLQLVMPRCADGSASTTNVTTSYEIAKNTTDNWQTITILLDNAWINNKSNGASSFRLTSPKNADDRDEQLRVSKVVIKNADHIPVDVIKKPTASQPVTIHVASDSNAAYYTPAATANSGIVGWGMRLGNFVTNRVEINNQATAGASTSTFKNMPAILDAVNPGDYVLISFYGNDANANSGGQTTIDQYKANLTKFINDIRKEKGVPILLTPKCYFNGSTNEYRIEAAGVGIEPYQVAAKEIAKSLDVELIDVYARMVEEQYTFTAEQRRAMYIADNVHLSDSGATYVARLIMEGLKEVTNVLPEYITVE